jgi:hypothetical protein
VVGRTARLPRRARIRSDLLKDAPLFVQSKTAKIPEKQKGDEELV